MIKRQGLHLRGNHPTSPPMLAIYMLVFFIISSIIPPNIYSYYLNEPDFMFFDPYALTLVVLCTISFILAYLTLSSLPDIKLGYRLKSVVSVKFRTFIIIPIFFCSILSLVYDLLIIYRYPNVPLLSLTGHGNMVKHIFEINTPQFGSFLYLNVITIFWAISNVFARGLKDKKTFIVIFFSSALLIISYVLTMQRGQLVFFMSGLLVIYFTFHFSASITPRELIKNVFISVLLLMIIIIFITMFFFLRSVGPNHLFSYILGYGPASFNRLAAIINGNLVYRYGVTGFYMAPFLLHLPILDKIANINIFNFPHAAVVFTSEFNSLARAGLNSRFNWATVYGYIYSSIGWATPIYFMLLGFICSFVWGHLKRATQFGFAFYPFIGASILFWFTTNTLFMSEAVMSLFGAILLHFYSELVSIKTFPRVPLNIYFANLNITL